MKTISALMIAATFTLPALTTACTKADAPATAANANAPANDKEWSMPNKNYASTRYSTLNTINTEKRG